MAGGSTTSDRIVKFYLPVATVLLAAMLSALISRATAQYTANQILQGEIAQGYAVLDDIGYRYFSVIAYLEGKYNSEDGGLDSIDSGDWAFYRRILADLKEDIQWLRTNPTYSYAQIRGPVWGSLAYLQNALVQEIAFAVKDISRPTLIQMCSIYNSSERWKNTASESNLNNAAVGYARVACEVYQAEVEALGVQVDG